MYLCIGCTGFSRIWRHVHHKLVKLGELRQVVTSLRHWKWPVTSVMAPRRGQDANDSGQSFSRRQKGLISINVL